MFALPQKNEDLFVELIAIFYCTPTHKYSHPHQQRQTIA